MPVTTIVPLSSEVLGFGPGAAGGAGALGSPGVTGVAAAAAAHLDPADPWRTAQTLPTGRTARATTSNNPQPEARRGATAANGTKILSPVQPSPPQQSRLDATYGSASISCFKPKDLSRSPKSIWTAC